MLRIYSRETAKGFIMNVGKKTKNISPEQANLDKNLLSGFLKRSYSPSLVFWMIFALMTVLSSFRFIKEGELIHFIYRQSFEVLILVIALFINNKVLVPHFLRKKKGLAYALLLITTVLALAVFQFFLTKLLQEFNIDLTTPFESRAPKGAFIFNAVPLLFLVMLNFFIRVFQEWASFQDIETKLQEAKKEALKVQLENLKAQVNPHFLFNTLNNIYSLSLFKDERTPETILKLSDLLSYMIYDCRGDKVRVDKEMEFIENYTTLEKLRFNENAGLEVSIDKNWNGDEMAPLLFAPFIENAFKHGMNIQSREPEISILVENRENEHLHFVCKNFTDNIKNPGPGGIGLKNVKSRLDLLYPDRHELSITNEDGCFTVDLDIDISQGPELAGESKEVEV